MLITTISDITNDFHPQIYYEQIYQINEDKTINFNLKYNFFMVLKWIQGYGELQLDENGTKLELNNNFIGKSFYYQISNINNISIINTENLTFSLKFDYIIKNTYIKELYSDEPIADFFFKIIFQYIII